MQLDVMQAAKALPHRRDPDIYSEPSTFIDRVVFFLME